MEFCAGEVMSDFAGLFQLETPYLGYWLFGAASAQEQTAPIF